MRSEAAWRRSRVYCLIVVSVLQQKSSTWWGTSQANGRTSSGMFFYGCSQTDQMFRGKTKFKVFNWQTKFQLTNTKYQLTNTKFQLTNTQFQLTNTKFQLTNEVQVFSCVDSKMTKVSWEILLHQALGRFIANERLSYSYDWHLLTAETIADAIETRRWPWRHHFRLLFQPSLQRTMVLLHYTTHALMILLYYTTLDTQLII